MRAPHLATQPPNGGSYPVKAQGTLMTAAGGFPHAELGTLTGQLVSQRSNLVEGVGLQCRGGRRAGHCRKQGDSCRPDTLGHANTGVITGPPKARVQQPENRRTLGQ